MFAKRAFFIIIIIIYYFQIALYSQMFSVYMVFIYCMLQNVF